MKKSDLATLTYGTNRLLQINDTMSDFLVETIRSSLSLLATAEPELAISVIDQLLLKKTQIQDYIVEKDKHELDGVKELSKSLPDHLDLTDPEEVEKPKRKKPGMH